MRRVSRNTIILFLNNAGGAAFSFASAVVIGRGLGKGGLGQYAFILAWSIPFTMLADFGLGTLVTRDAARDKSQIGTLLHSANRTLPFIAGLTLLLSALGILATQTAPMIIAALGLGSLLIVLDPWYGLYTAAFRAFEHMQPIFIVNVGGLALQLALTIWLIQNNTGIFGAVAAVIVVNAGQLVAIWVWWRLWRRAGLAALTTEPAAARLDRFILLRRAAPFALAAVIGALAVRLNILLLDRIAGDAATGQYSAASRFVEAGRLFPNAVFGAMFPALAALSTDRAALRRFFRQGILALGGLSGLLAIGAALTAPLLIRLSYGAAFNDAVPVLALLSWSLVPAAGRGLLSLYLYSAGREGLVNRVGILTLLFQAGVGLAAVTAFGAMGAALTAILTESAAVVMLLWFSRAQR